MILDNFSLPAVYTHTQFSSHRLGEHTRPYYKAPGAVLAEALTAQPSASCRCGHTHALAAGRKQR